MIKPNPLSPDNISTDNIFLKNIVFSEYEDISGEYKKWLKENIENEGNGFKFEELNRISFLLSILNLLKKEEIDFSSSDDISTRLIINSRKLEKYINDLFIANNTDVNIENIIKELINELLKTEELLNDKSDFYEKSKKIILNTENKISIIMGGGGPGGMSHLGALKVLAKNNIPVHIIGGISMGSIIGIYLSMIIQENGQINEKSIDFIIDIVKNIKYGDELIETKGDKKYIKTSEILNNYLKSLGDNYSKVPFDIQVRLLEDDKKIDGVIFENDKKTKFEYIELQAKASAANKNIFPELSSVEIDGKEYEDDTSIAISSISSLVKHTREKYRPSLVIGLPVSSIDLVPKIRDILFKNFDSFKDFRDQGDIKIESYKDKGLLINSFYKLDGFKLKFFARNESELKDGKIELPIEEYISLGEKAGEDKIGEIFKSLGLIKFK